jgi:hypothetical protein
MKFEIHIHQYESVRQSDGVYRKQCMICGKIKG